mmetsp:Transcript_29612/g.55402  ORF Transcript_29612/g.55402 Transcript_29612/m.55402 type:complete len:219 (-) Transcript_29612:839-1495(-)
MPLALFIHSLLGHHSSPLPVCSLKVSLHLLRSLEKLRFAEVERLGPRETHTHRILHCTCLAVLTLLPADLKLELHGPLLLHINLQLDRHLPIAILLRRHAVVPVLLLEGLDQVVEAVGKNRLCHDERDREDVRAYPVDGLLLGFLVPHRNLPIDCGTDSMVLRPCLLEAPPDSPAGRPALQEVCGDDVLDPLGAEQAQDRFDGGFLAQHRCVPPNAPL